MIDECAKAGRQGPSGSQSALEQPQGLLSGHRGAIGRLQTGNTLALLCNGLPCEGHMPDTQGHAVLGCVHFYSASPVALMVSVPLCLVGEPFKTTAQMRGCEPRSTSVVQQTANRYAVADCGQFSPGARSPLRGHTPGGFALPA